MKTENEDRILISFLEDKALQCSRNQVITCSRFLDMHERSIASFIKLPEGVTRVFFGQDPDAERTVACYLPSYVEAADSDSLMEYFAENPEDCPIKVLDITKDRFSRPLSHRDYLGAVMGLGINRDITGDIIVSEKGCLMSVTSNMAEYICSNLSKAGRGTLTVSVAYPWEVKRERLDNGVEEFFTVSGLRLDSIVKNAFSLSRDAASEAISKGLVFVNDTECFKPDRRVTGGDKITLRHKGRVIIDDCSGVSKKGRIIVKTRKYG